MMRRLCLWVGIALWAAGAGAQSFDCSLAKSAVEKAICADKTLSAADVAMAAKYKQVLASVPPDVQAQVRADQRIWLRGVAVHCKGQSGNPLSECIAGEYKTQMTALDQRVMTMGGVTFVTHSIELLAKDEKDDPWSKDPSLEQNPGFGTVNASWPQATSGETAWVAWNAAVLAETQRMAGGGQDKGAIKGWQNDWAAGEDSNVTASVRVVTPQLVSTAITNEGMGHGAAHPYESYETFHWMLKEQRKLTVADVFKPGWEAVVTARCRASLEQQVGDDYESYTVDFAKRLHAVVADPANWDFDAKGLSVSFPEYSVTPRAEPVDEVEVPWAALKAYLNPTFVLPQ